MKTLFASLFIFAVTTMSFNSEAETNPFVICDGLSDIATTVMETRQSGITQQESIDLIDKDFAPTLKQVHELMIELAYAEPLENTPELKHASIILFASLQRSECILTLY